MPNNHNSLRRVTREEVDELLAKANCRYSHGACEHDANGCDMPGCFCAKYEPPEKERNLFGDASQAKYPD